MQRTGIANLPLHYGKCPAWLFGRMKKLGGVISDIIVDEYGQDEYIRRLSDPYFFQALGCVLGFDWHSSGLTVTTLGALKEALNNQDIGVKIAGMERRNFEMLRRAHEIQPRTYEELAALKGIGAKAIRSLALISELVYGARASWKDPARYSFAHGGKDGVPYPVDRRLMDENTELIKNAVRNAKIGEKEKINAIKRLREVY